MRIADLGDIQIAVTRKANGIMSVGICAENRNDSLHMDTQKDETVDQFVVRIKSMLRSMINGEGRKVEEVPKPEVKKSPTFDQQKKELTTK